jgi:hypothetical protein
MNKPQTSSPRARLQALQAIPERQRTEEEWDELNELEIMFAAGNRDTGGRDRGMPGGGPERGNSAPPHDRGPPREGGQDRWRDGNPQQQPQGQRKGGDGGPGGGGRKGPRKFHKKPPKNNPPR